MLWNRTVRAGPATSGDEADDLRQAYRQGRRDERRARRRHPVLMSLIVLTALAGAVLLALALREGSFSRSGALVDRGVATAAREAGPAVREAARDAGAAVEETRRTRDADEVFAGAPNPN